MFLYKQEKIPTKLLSLFGLMVALDARAWLDIYKKLVHTLLEMILNSDKI